MPELSHDEAIARARIDLSLDIMVAARAWRVRRLDRPADAYYLVVFGEDNAAVAVAAVGVARGEIRNSALLPGRGPHLVTDDSQAITRAGADDDVQVELVWQPCRASRSPLYPFWQIRTPAGTLYVDQHGSVWQELAAAGPGG